MNKYAVIVAGGAGTRMGASSPKQFLPLQGKPVLWHTLSVFLDAYEDLEIILVLPEEYLGEGRALADAHAGRIRVTAGGATRFHSVQRGLELISRAAGLARDAGAAAVGAAPAEDSVIFVHDGVRCLLTVDLVRRCYACAVQFGSAIPVIGSRDSVRLVTPDGSEAVERSLVKLVQTPQTFLGHILLPAFGMAAELGYQERFTDEATVVEAAGHRVHLVEGETDNIKITTPADMIVAEELLGRRPG